MENINAFNRSTSNMPLAAFVQKDYLLNKALPDDKLAEILFITSYPPRECGIATYSQDLITALEKQFVNSFSLKVCAIESNNEQHQYADPAIKYKLNTSRPESFSALATAINNDAAISTVVLQHEFGFFAEQTDAFNSFIKILKKPLIFVFHTVLPTPTGAMKANMQAMLNAANGIIVMTNFAAEILQRDYDVRADLPVSVIPHGTHLVPHLDKDSLKEKYGLQGKKVLSTFGLLSSGKSIETTLDALPSIVNTSPEVIFLIIGKTHPTVALHEGESYREMLEHKIETLNLKKHVKFINSYLPLKLLLEYLQMTDI